MGNRVYIVDMDLDPEQPQVITLPGHSTPIHIEIINQEK